MEIEWIASHQEAQLLVPMPKPAKTYIPDWYKDIKINDYDYEHYGSKIILKNVFHI
jgi:hypothetical protein